MVVTLIIFLLILSVLVIVHEMGHFFTAKYFGVKVDEFGIGFPPKASVVHTSKDGVKWTLNWLPLGGFVKFKGEDGSGKDEPDSFVHKSPWKRVVILSAGVVMNLILAFILLTAGFSIGWPQDLTNATVPKQYVKNEQVIVIYVEKNTPAYTAGIEVGDIIEQVNGTQISDHSALQSVIEKSGGIEVELGIARAGERINKKLIPENITFTPDKENVDVKPIEKIGIGVALGKLGVVQYPIHKALVIGFTNTGLYAGKIVAAFYNLIKDIIVHRTVSQNIGGPVTIAVLSGKVARLGFIHVIQFIALLSLNLAIINILPIPALDGGRVLFVLIEKFKGRAVSIQVENSIHFIGFWLLILVTILITVRDIQKFQLWDKVKNFIVS